MSDVFLSYAREDVALARQFASLLESEGLSVWWDRTIPPGRTWAEVIEEEIQSARCVLVLWSPASVKSTWVNKEARKGESLGTLVPAVIEPDVQPPFEFEHIQAADLSDWEGARSHPQLVLLLQEVAAVLARRSDAGPPRPATKRPRRPARRRSRGWLGFALAGVGAAAGIVGLVTLGWGGLEPPSPGLIEESGDRVVQEEEGDPGQVLKLAQLDLNREYVHAKLGPPPKTRSLRGDMLDAYPYTGGALVLGYRDDAVVSRAVRVRTDAARQLASLDGSFDSRVDQPEKFYVISAATRVEYWELVVPALGTNGLRAEFQGICGRVPIFKIEGFPIGGLWDLSAAYNHDGGKTGSGDLAGTQLEEALEIWRAWRKTTQPDYRIETTAPDQVNPIVDMLCEPF